MLLESAHPASRADTFVSGNAPGSSMAILVAWCRSVAAYAFLCGYVLAVGPPGLVVTWLTGRVAHLFRLGYVGASIARRVLGVRLDVRNLERVDGNRPVVYVMNHSSNVDAVIFEVLFPRCPRLRAIYKSEMGKLPILGQAMRIAGFVPVERRDREQAMAAVDLAIERVRAGDSFLLAPEGTRNPGAGLLPFKKGAFVLAIKAGVPVVPIAIVGAATAMPRGRYYVTPERVTVMIGEPIPTAGLEMDDRDRLAGQAKSAMLAMLNTPGVGRE